jgi:putative transposase
MIARLAEPGETAMACRLLGASRSGYWSWQRRRPGRRTRENIELTGHLRRIHEESKKTYGVPRMVPELKKLGWRVSRNRVARLMKKAGLRGLQRRGWRPTTTKSKHSLPVSPNLLQDRRPVLVPGKVWVADITYIGTQEGWLYVAAVMDLGSRRIVGWVSGSRMKADLVTGAVRQAIDRGCSPSGMIHHSDRGSQYASTECRQLLQRAGISCSMSHPGNCYENAEMESFWSTLKTECVYRGRYQTRQEAHLVVFSYIEGFYNRRRLHSSLGYRSPEEYEAQFRTQSTYPSTSEKTG